MIKEIRDKGMSSSKVKERATILAKGIKQVKKLGITITPNEPIEGKIFW